MHPHLTPRQQFVRVCECGCGQPTLLAVTTCARRGLVKGQPLAYVYTHQSRRLRPVEDRFWEKVDKSGDCWVWTAWRDALGYGYFARSGSGSGMIKAHRMAYILTHGAIPEGMAICHRCDNPSCVNPAHLWADTISANNQDKARKGRVRVLTGEQSTWSKLTDDDVRAIRRRVAAGELQRAIAHDYHIAQAHVSAIARRAAWKHLP